MRNAFGKPYGTCARVSGGQILFSIRCRDSHAAVAKEALKHAKSKLSGKQKLVVSTKYGFSRHSSELYALWMRYNHVSNDPSLEHYRETAPYETCTTTPHKPCYIGDSSLLL